MRHPIKATARATVAPLQQRNAPTPPQWPSFTGTAQFVGTTASGRVTVYVDPTTGQSGLQNAQDLLNRSEEHTSELQSRLHLVCRLLLEKKKYQSPSLIPYTDIRT